MHTSQPPAQDYADDEIDLRQLVTVLWQQKTVVAGIGILGAALGLGGSLYSTKYVTEGLFLTPSAPRAANAQDEPDRTLSAADFKRYESVLTNGSRLQQYLQSTSQSTTPEGQMLFHLAENPNALASALKPEFGFTERDSKTYGVKVNGDGTSAMIGVRIEFSHKEPTGGTPVTLLAEYVRDSIIRVDMGSAMLSGCNRFRYREQELRNAQIQSEFLIRQEESRVTALRKIIANNPAVNSIDSRQIVSLDKGNERFLSPAAQLVAAEIQIADLQLEEVSRERERMASAIKRDYYCLAQQALQQPTTGKNFLVEVGNLQATVFQTHDRTNDVVEETWNELDVERQNWENTYLSSMRFVAPPEGSETKQRKPGPALGIVLGGMLGGILGGMIALIRAWWRGNPNRDDVTPKKA